ncbi:hypothetical protein BgiBS90_003201, partial [Biomphalaria glabrata]
AYFTPAVRLFGRHVTTSHKSPPKDELETRVPLFYFHKDGNETRCWLSQQDSFSPQLDWSSGSGWSTAERKKMLTTTDIKSTKI